MHMGKPKSYSKLFRVSKSLDDITTAQWLKCAGSAAE